jgi:hypothetical protein
LMATYQGTTGFDVDVSWGQLRVEVPGRPRKTTGKTISADDHTFALAA